MDFDVNAKLGKETRRIIGWPLHASLVFGNNRSCCFSMVFDDSVLIIEENWTKSMNAIYLFY